MKPLDFLHNRRKLTLWNWAYMLSFQESLPNPVSHPQDMITLEITLISGWPSTGFLVSRFLIVNLLSDLLKVMNPE